MMIYNYNVIENNNINNLVILNAWNKIDVRNL
jgi:hypothetical protein